MRRLQAEQQALMDQPRESPHVLLQKHKDVPLKAAQRGLSSTVLAPFQPESGLSSEVCELKFPQKEARLLVKRWRKGHSEQRARPESSPSNSSPTSPEMKSRPFETPRKGLEMGSGWRTCGSCGRPRRESPW